MQKLRPVRVQVLPGKVSDCDYNGKFHQWGVDFIETENSPWAAHTVGIVESENGVVQSVSPNQITFLDTKSAFENYGGLG